MKRFVLIGAALAAFSLPLFADDASVLPGRVLRVYAVPTYITIPGGYDDSGKYQKTESGQGKIDAFNLGVAVEYGVTDWWGLGIQWTPGYTLGSKVDVDLGGSKGNVNGPADVFVGGKFLLVGPKSPIVSQQWRFAVSPGVIVPFGALDADKQFKNLQKGDDVTLADSDKHVFAYGGRGFLDYIVNENFFLDLYTQYIQYTKATGRKLLNPTGTGAVAALSGGTDVPTSFDSDIDFGNKFTLEFEPHYTINSGDDLSFSFGLPFTYVATAAEKVTTNNSTYANDFALAGVSNGSTNAGYTLSVTPSASVFFYKTPIVLPIELKADYSLPLAGKNNAATTYLDLQIRAYAQF